MDLTESITPKSDQLNAEDMLIAPMTVTVESVTKGKAEQPFDFNLVEHPGRAYRPSKTMRKVIVKAWGAESDAYAGRRMTLYRDPDVKFGGQKVGGIKISHMSHIDKAFTLVLAETRMSRAAHTVEPLKATRTPAPVDQFTVMLAALKSAGLDDKDDALATIREITGRDDINNPRADLTPDETQTIIDTLGAVTGSGAA